MLFHVIATIGLGHQNLLKTSIKIDPKCLKITIQVKTSVKLQKFSYIIYNGYYNGPR